MDRGGRKERKGKKKNRSKANLALRTLATFAV
jgi:hypothetical protein